eukprot:356074-Chlamydomonas_euryale.AAC.3
MRAGATVSCGGWVGVQRKQRPAHKRTRVHVRMRAGATVSWGVARRQCGKREACRRCDRRLCGKREVGRRCDRHTVTVASPNANSLSGSAGLTASVSSGTEAVKPRPFHTLPPSYTEAVKPRPFHTLPPSYTAHLHVAVSPAPSTRSPPSYTAHLHVAVGAGAQLVGVAYVREHRLVAVNRGQVNVRRVGDRCEEGALVAVHLESRGAAHAHDGLQALRPRQVPLEVVEHLRAVRGGWCRGGWCGSVCSGRQRGEGGAWRAAWGGI